MDLFSVGISTLSTLFSLTIDIKNKILIFFGKTELFQKMYLKALKYVVLTFPFDTKCTVSNWINLDSYLHWTSSFSLRCLIGAVGQSLKARFLFQDVLPFSCKKCQFCRMCIFHQKDISTGNSYLVVFLTSSVLKIISGISWKQALLCSFAILSALFVILNTSLSCNIFGFSISTPKNSKEV